MTRSIFDNRLFLTVDDNPINNLLLRKYCQRWGAQCLEAQTAQSASEIFARNDLDLVFMDINLPDANGYDLAADFKRLRPRIPIIGISAAWSRGRPIDNGQGALDAMLPKPVMVDELFSLIVNALPPAD